MAKILKFPTPEERKQKEKAKIIEDAYQESRDTVEEASNECVQTAQFLMDVLEEFIVTGQASDLQQFMSMNFRDETQQESRDMFAIVNLINAMLNRRLGIPHVLTKELDRSYLQTKLTIKKNEEARENLEEEMDIFFEPEFDLDGDDDDSN
jgi:hypothetical protein